MPPSPFTALQGINAGGILPQAGATQGTGSAGFINLTPADGVGVTPDGQLAYMPGHKGPMAALGRAQQSYFQQARRQAQAQFGVRYGGMPPTNSNSLVSA